MDPQAQPFTPQAQPSTPQAKPSHTTSAVVVRGIPTSRRIWKLWHWMEEDNKGIGLKILRARWLLQEAWRVGKQASSVVLYLASEVKTGTRLRMGQKCFTTCAYDFDRGSTTKTRNLHHSVEPSMSTEELEELAAQLRGAPPSPAPPPPAPPPPPPAPMFWEATELLAWRIQDKDDGCEMCENLGAKIARLNNVRIMLYKDCLNKIKIGLVNPKETLVETSCGILIHKEILELGKKVFGDVCAPPTT